MRCYREEKRMKPETRSAVALATALAAAIAAAPAVSADEYPTRPVEVIHQFGPGGGTDLFVRAIATPFREITGQNMVSVSVQGGTCRQPPASCSGPPTATR